MDKEKIKKVINDSESGFVCSSCWEEFNDGELFKKHKSEVHPQHGGIPERLFFFVKYNDKMVALNEKSALVQGLDPKNSRHNFKEYLGMIETADPAILDKSIDEIRAMNLPKVKPKEFRKTIMGARTGGHEQVYNKVEDILQ